MARKLLACYGSGRRTANLAARLWLGEAVLFGLRLLHQGLAFR